MRLLLLAALLGCGADPIATERVGNSVNLELLFEKDGCSMYRFLDHAHYHYWSTCQGTVTTQQNCGKNCTYPESIQTERR